MYMRGTSYIIVFILSICLLYFLGIIYLSKRRKTLLGLSLPVIFGCIAIFNFLKPILVHNPYPNMKEPMYMTFFGALSIVGFIIFFFIKYRSKKKSNYE